MLGKAMQGALNEQIKHEIDSAYLYLSMAMYADSMNLPGMGSWLRVQWQEELGHAIKLIGIIHDRGGRVVLEAIEKPPVEYKSPLAVFQQVLVHEQEVSALIHRLYEVSIKENDYACQVEIQWFIKEQVEEEKTAAMIIDQLTMAGESGASLLLLDRQLATRGQGK
jgi:ferritin